MRKGAAEAIIVADMLDLNEAGTDLRTSKASAGGHLVGERLALLELSVPRRRSDEARAPGVLALPNGDFQAVESTVPCPPDPEQ